MQAQRSESSRRAVTLTVITPDAPPVTLLCDAIRLTLQDNRKGKGGGAYGIRPGHAPAVLSLGHGVLEARRGGRVNLRLTVAGGFARVGGDQVTVVTEHAESLDETGQTNRTEREKEEGSPWI